MLRRANSIGARCGVSIMSRSKTSLSRQDSRTNRISSSGKITALIWIIMKDWNSYSSSPSGKLESCASVGILPNWLWEIGTTSSISTSSKADIDALLGKDSTTIVADDEPLACLFVRLVYCRFSGCGATEVTVGRCGFITLFTSNNGIVAEKVPSAKSCLCFSFQP